MCKWLKNSLIVAAVIGIGYAFRKTTKTIYSPMGRKHVKELENYLIIKSLKGDKK